MKTYDAKLMERRDKITAHFRNLRMHCHSQLDMTKVSGGATLFLECWGTLAGANSKIVLLMVDKWGGVNVYRPVNQENNMEKEMAAVTEWVTGNKSPQ